MAVTLSPVAGAAGQFFTGSGAVLTGGKLYTYAAGTTTPQTTYTTSAGNIPHTNPIILDAAGRVPSGGEVWATTGVSYKFVLKDANDVLIATYDNVFNVGDAEQISYNPPFVGAVTTNVEAKLAQIASAKDYGAIGNGIADDTAAIQAALNGSLCVTLPAGTYKVTSALTFNANNQLIGEGRAVTTLSYSGSSVFIQFPQNPTIARCAVRNLSIINTSAKNGTGISFQNSFFNVVENVRVTGFNYGFRFNYTTAGGAFSARNVLRDFEANECNIGVQLGASANVETVGPGRVWYCFNSGNGIGIDLNACESIALININVESCDTCIKGSNNASFNLTGGYVEKGAGSRNFNIDNTCRFNTSAMQVNGDRNFIGWLGDEKNTFQAPAGESFYGGAFAGVSAADRQYLQNPDFSRDFQTWSAGGSITATLDTVNYVTGGKSADLTATLVGSYIGASISSFEGDVKNIVVCVRYKNISSVDFKVNVVSGVTLIGQGISSTVSADWETMAISCAISSPASGATIRIYPDATNGTGQVLVDAVWVVRGSYAVAQKPYRQYVQLLSTPVVLSSGTTSANVAIAAMNPSPVPTGAVGCMLRVALSSVAADTYVTEVSIHGTGGSPLYAAVNAVKNDRNTVVDLTIPSTNPQRGVTITNGTNTTTYSISLLGWVLES